MEREKLTQANTKEEDTTTSLQNSLSFLQQKKKAMAKQRLGHKAQYFIIKAWA